MVRCELDAEGGAAAAGALDVRIIELEAGAFDGFDVVNGDAVEIHFAHLVDEDFKAVEFVDIIAGFVYLIFEGHVITEAGAAASDDSDAQARGNGVLLRDDFFDFSNGD